MPEEITKSECLQNRDACHNSMATQIKLEVSKVLAPLARIEERQQAMGAQLSDLTGLYGRVSMLEIWKGNLNGRAASLAANPNVNLDAVREHIQEAVTASQGAILLELRTRSNDGVTLPKWALAGVGGLLLVIIVLAVFAGERALPYLPGIKTTTTTTRTEPGPK